MLENVDLNLLSILIFILVLAGIIYKDRRKFKRDSIFLYRKTQRGKKFIISLGTGYPRFWKVAGTIGVVIGFVMSFYILFLLFSLFATSIITQTPATGVGIVLPTPSAEASFTPGAFFVPFWYWIISIALLIVVHEGLHGVLAAREKVRIKSLGVGVLAVLPLAFVEPDEKQLAKKSIWAQLRVFAAGSFANFILAFLCVIIVIGLFAPMFVPSGIMVGGVLNNTPAQQVNLTGVIVGINEYEIRTVQDLNNALERIGVGQDVTIRTKIISPGGEEARIYTMRTIQNPNDLTSTKGFLGITFNQNAPEYRVIRDEFRPYEGVVNWLINLLFFIYLLNLGVGTFNLLPIRFLDGGRMWEIVIQRYSPRKYKEIMNTISLVVAFIIIGMFASILF